MCRPAILAGFLGELSTAEEELFTRLGSSWGLALDLLLKPSRRRTQEGRFLNDSAVGPKFEEDASGRGLPATVRRIITVCATGMSLYHLYCSYNMILPPMWHRSIHLTLSLAVVFLAYPFLGKEKRKVPFYDVVLLALSVAFTVYLIADYWNIVNRAGAPVPADVWLGVVVILLTLEATRRVMGWPLVIVSLVFLAYAFLGPYMPGLLQHRGYTIKRLAEEMYLTTNGIYGVPLYVSSTFVIIFIIFGAILRKSGGSKFFIDLAFALTGRSRGGPAKAAVLSSGLMGTISGSAFANVVGTGTFTIPLMKSVGYEPEFAGGVEAAASTGGQIAPPIMGAAAFIMAEMIGISYNQLIVNAAFPAFLYYLALYVMVDLRAAKIGLKGLPKDRLPDIWKVLEEGFQLLIPPLGIVYFLLAGYSPIKASFYAVVLVFVVTSLRKTSRMSLVQIVEALEEGARSAATVAVCCGTCGIIVGVVTLTGLGLKLADLILKVSGGLLVPTLLLTMVASLIMGMGMPTTALYVILASMVAPALVKIGVPVVGAHLFIFYFGVFAAVTPPVAVTSYLAAAIADGHPARTAFEGFKLSLIAFIVPFIFVTSPELLLLEVDIPRLLVMVATAVAGIYALGSSLQGYFFDRLSPWERLVLFVCAINFIDPNLGTDLLAMGIIGLVGVLQVLKRRRLASGRALS